MKNFLAILLVLACISAAFGDVRLIMVDGYCYLEGQNEHSESKVKFIKVSPSAITDSTYTDSSGYFFISDLREGIYDIEYTHAGFDTIRVEDQLLVSGTTLPPVTLNWPFSDVDGYCYLEGPNEHSETKVKFIKVSLSAITDSTYTDSSGYFMMTHLREGTFDVKYTHEGFDTVTIEDQTFVSSTTLPPVTLEHSPLSGALSGTLGPGEYTIIGEISITAGDSLRLLPRTTFIFDGPYYFGIWGTLLAEGTESDSIVFTTEQSGTNRWRGLRFLWPASSGSRLSYCLIEKGYSNNGGGVCCLSSSPTFTNCTISGNSAHSYGGGVYCSSSSPALTNCTISGNSASASGNYVYAYGGGVYCSSSSPALTNCIISGNSAIASGYDWSPSYGYGGGVYCDYSSSPALTNCTISGNWASAGGGYYSYANAYGGGVYCSSSSPALMNCIISGNSASASGYNPHVYGGGVYCYYSSPTFTNCTLNGNSATASYAYGGGVYCESSSPTIKSTIIAFSNGSGVFFQGGAAGQIIYCDFFGNSGGNIVGTGPPGIGQIVTTNANCDPCDVYHNIFLDPMFADTAAEDYHLTDLSHCIGAGDPADTMSTDFEGDPRPNPPGSFPDIGTDENPNAQPSFGPCQLSGPLQCILDRGVCHVVGEIWINAGDSLTLLPGTTFIFDGSYPFRIYGTLLAEGTESDSIVFTTDTLLNPNRWRGLRFQDSTSSGSRLAYCVIEKGYATGNYPNTCGGGVFCDNNSSPTFTYCAIAENSADGYGGGVYCYSSSPSFTNCTLSGNSAFFGGGVHCQNYSSPIFRSCTISGNAAGYAGGVFCNVSQAIFTNCAINGNSGTGDGGGVFCAGNPSPIVMNCTLSQNSAPYGAGAYCDGFSVSSFRNTIIAFSNGPGIYFDHSAGSQIEYCNIFGNTGGNFTYSGNDPTNGPPMIGVPLVTNPNADSADIYMNIFVDPMFADTSAGDYHLTDFSHCIGAGDPADTVSTDFESDPRPNPSWSYPDIGADEHWSGSPVLHLVVSMSSGNAVLHWTPFGAGPYYIYGATTPFTAGTLLDTVSDATTWMDEETASRPSRYFYYVMAEWPGR